MQNLVRAVTVALLALFLASCQTGGDHAVPSNNRNWQEPVSRQPRVKWSSATRFTLTNIRDWDYDENGETRKRWFNGNYDLRDVQAIWYFVEPFPYDRALAHTFATFEIGRGASRHFITVSVEARKEVGEKYNPVLGLGSAYELMFVWSSEKDILTDTVIHLGHELRAYKINVPPHQAAVILHGFLERTEELAKKPQFYQTLKNNCTSELAAVVNAEYPGSIPQHPSFTLTGLAARYLHSLGYLGDPDTDFKKIDAKAEIGDPVRANAHLSDSRFSIAIRRALEKR